MDRLKKFLVLIRERTLSASALTTSLIRRKPMTSFMVSMALLSGLILAGNYLRRPKSEVSEIEDRVKKVSIYQIGSSPRLQLEAKAEKSGVVTIVAQTAGVVRKINAWEGDRVNSGQSVVLLSTTYGGANLASVQRQIAQKQYENTRDTFDLQKEIIGKQREISEKSDENSDRLREISRESVEDSQGLLQLNEDILNQIDDNLSELESATNSAENAALILTSKQLKSQVQAGINQLRSAIRSGEYSGADDEPPAELADLQREMTLKQLEIQEKALDLSREMSKLNLRLAQISEALMAPQTPFKGTVERIHVKVGQTVAPGTPIASINGDSQKVRLVALTSEEIARNISKIEASRIMVDGETYEVYPKYISEEATNERLYSVVFALPDELTRRIEDREFVTVEVPVGSPNSGSSVPYLPLDSVYQTQDQAYILVMEDGKAVSREVVPGAVYGRFVVIEEGLKDGDMVILSRNVVGGDRVERE